MKCPERKSGQRTEAMQKVSLSPRPVGYPLVAEADTTEAGCSQTSVLKQTPSASEPPCRPPRQHQLFLSLPFPCCSSRRIVEWNWAAMQCFPVVYNEAKSMLSSPTRLSPECCLQVLQRQQMGTSRMNHQRRERSNLPSVRSRGSRRSRCWYLTHTMPGRTAEGERSKNAHIVRSFTRSSSSSSNSKISLGMR